MSTRTLSPAFSSRFSPSTKAASGTSRISFTGGTLHAVLVLYGRQRNRTRDLGAGALCCFDDLTGRGIKYAIVVRLESNANSLSYHLKSLRATIQLLLRDPRSQKRDLGHPSVFPSACYRYLMISLMVPAPTVRPPSRIAKRRPFSMATGVCSSISSCTLSPGITISVPSGSFAVPVTSVVRK